MVSDDVELAQTVGDIFADDYTVGVLPCSGSVTAIAEQHPDMLLVGPASTHVPLGSLGAWDIVALARAHRDLARVPIIVLTPDLDSMMADPLELRAHSNVHVIGMPFDIEVLTGVARSIERAARDDLVAIADVGLASPTPLVCVHGYEFDGDGRFGRCTTCA